MPAKLSRSGKVCTATGKRVYTSKVRALMSNAQRPLMARAYRCPHCGYWHLTRKEG